MKLPRMLARRDLRGFQDLLGLLERNLSADQMQKVIEVFRIDNNPFEYTMIEVAQTPAFQGVCG